MEAWWVSLLREQQRDGFPDFAGADASIRVPISDRWLSRVVAQRLPATAPVRELELMAEPGEVIAARVRLVKPAFLPPVKLRFVIEQQPDLPRSPVLVLGLASEGITAVAATALRYVDVLPPGVRFDGRRFLVDLSVLLARYGATDMLDYVRALRITTAPGVVIVHAQLSLPHHT